MCLRRGWAREGQNEREKKEGKRWQWCWGGERRNLWKLNDERTSYESAGTSAPHTHTCSGHGCYSCVLCLCALCTHAWTHLPLPTNLCCVSVYFVCVREILARPLWFNPLLCVCVCTCAHVYFSIPHYEAVHCVCVTTCNLSPVTRALLSCVWIICLYPISNLLSNGYYQPSEPACLSSGSLFKHHSRSDVSMRFISHKELVCFSGFFFSSIWVL